MTAHEAAPAIPGALFRNFANLAALALLAVLVATNLEPSETPNVWRYSYLKLAIFAGLGLATAYFLRALWSPTLQRINGLLLYAVVFNVILLEIVLRLYPQLLPVELIPLLPVIAREDVAAERGLPTRNDYRGEGLYYALNPAIAPMRDAPWVRLDADGYRNPAVPQGGTDIVLLGDSVIYAKEAKADLADHFRAAGRGAYNLAIGNYSPFQYRDAYRRMVIDRALPHRRLLVFINLANDFEESLTYRRVQERGGSWTDFMSTGAASGPDWAGRQPLWMVAILASLPDYARNLLTDVRGLMNRWLAERGSVVLPYATYPVDRQFLELREVDADAEPWLSVSSALDDVVDAAAAAGAQVTIFLVPNTAILFAPYIRGLDALMPEFQRRYAARVALFHDRYTPRGVEVADLTPAMSVAVGERLITLGLNYHYNTEGTAQLHRVVAARLAR